MLKFFGSKDLSKINRPIMGMYMGLSDPALVVMAYNAGFDFVRIDMEHVMFSYGQVAKLIQTARLVGLEVQVRVSNTTDITKVLDQGATGIIVPDVESIEMTKDIVGRAKFAPIGHRGMYPVGVDTQYALQPFSPFMESANDHILTCIQLESVKALENIEEIIDVEGLDFVSSGKADLSESMGYLCQMNHPKVIEAENFIIQKALEFKKEPTVLASSKERIHELWDMGVKVVSVAYDQQLIAKALKNTVDSLF